MNNFTLPNVEARMSTFNLSETLMTTMNADNLYPVYSRELSPGDNFDIDISAVAKMNPLVAPFMSPLKMKFYAFWVPNSLVWKGWKEFMGEEAWSDSSPDRLVPSLKFTKAPVDEDIYDYFGIPVVKGVTPQEYTNAKISALRFRSYYKIWNDWFRAPLLQSPLKYSEDDIESDTGYTLQKVGKNYDLFTSCLPTPAVESVNIGLTGNAPVMTKSGKRTVVNVEQYPTDNKIYTAGLQTNGELNVVISDKSRVNFSDTDTNLYADMSQVLGVPITNLWHANALEVLLTKDNRYGRRYFEIVKAHWGIEMPDFLAGRSIFLGSVTNEVQVNPVVQNSSTDSVSPQGNLAGIGTLFASGKLCECAAVEHGQLIILASVQNENIYQQGLSRDLTRSTRYDYRFPEFENLIDEPILNRELMFTGKPGDMDVFGYAERYGSERTGYNRITGKLRSTATNSLDVWHLAEKFENVPKLNGTFIQSNVPLNRVLAVTDEPAFILSVKFDIRADRVLSKTSQPGIDAGRI